MRCWQVCNSRSPFQTVLFQFFIKLNLCVLYDPTIPILDIFIPILHKGLQRNMCFYESQTVNILIVHWQEEQWISYYIFFFLSFCFLSIDFFTLYFICLFKKAELEKEREWNFIHQPVHSPDGSQSWPVQNQELWAASMSPTFMQGYKALGILCCFPKP